MQTCIKYILALTAAFASSPAAQAADLLPVTAPQPGPASTTGWTFSFSPYFWAAGLNGKSQVFGLPTVDVSQDFGDILSDLDFAFMAAGDARYDRYSLFTDMSYVKISTGEATPRGILADSVGLKSVTFTAMLGAAYTVYEDQQTRFDVLAGARFWHAETTISLNGGLIGNLSRSDEGNWVDGLAGVKGSYAFTDTVYVTGWGMIGAGGADLDWDVLGAIGYKFSDTISAEAGYRAQGVNYSNDGFTYDMIQHGPILGMTIKF